MLASYILNVTHSTCNVVVTMPNISDMSHITSHLDRSDVDVFPHEIMIFIVEMTKYCIDTLKTRADIPGTSTVMHHINALMTPYRHHPPPSFKRLESCLPVEQFVHITLSTCDYFCPFKKEVLTPT